MTRTRRRTTRHRTTRHRTTRHRARPVLAAVAALCLLLLDGAVTAAPAAAAEPPFELRTDLEGPMFPVVTLSPARPVQRCARIGWSGAPPDQQAPPVLGVSVGASGDLAPALGIRMEVGRGGGAGGCAGFVPTALVFDGTLAQFAQQHTVPARRAGVAALTSASGEVAVRTVVVLPDDPSTQGRTAEAVLVLTASVPTPDAPVALPVPLTSPGPTGPQPRPDAPTGISSPGPLPPAEATGPALRIPLGPEPAARPRGPDGADAGADGGPGGAGGAARVWQVLERLVSSGGELLVAIAEPVARGARWGLWTLPLLLLFLLVQNRLDARDPKLAEAPTSHQPLLPFDEVPGPVAPVGPPRAGAA